MISELLVVGEVTSAWVKIVVKAPPPLTLYWTLNEFEAEPVPTMIVPSSVQSNFNTIDTIVSEMGVNPAHRQDLVTVPDGEVVTVEPWPVFMLPVTAFPPCPGSGVVFDVGCIVNKLIFIPGFESP